MPKYEVTVTEETQHSIELEADSQQEAESLAIDTLINDGLKTFTFIAVTERSATAVEIPS